MYHPYLTVTLIRKDSEEMEVEQCVEIQPRDEATVTAKCYEEIKQ